MWPSLLSVSRVPDDPGSAGRAPMARRARVGAARLGLLAMLAGAVVVALAVTDGRAEASGAYDQVVDLTFPVAGHTSYRDDYDHCRGNGCERRHQATDIMAPYGAPVHAAVGGTITWITGLDGSPPSYGYMIRIAGDDGRTYSYVHLGRQDRGPDEAYVAGLTAGTRVERGQHIGFNGCSGNASCDAPHLHLEIRDTAVTDPYGDPQINPYFSLQAAEARGDVPGGGCGRRAYAFAGDWDGSGRHGIGWWCDGRTALRTANGTVHRFTYGRPGDVPVVADWNGDGRDTVSIIRDGTWHVNNALRGGSASRTFHYGRVTRGDVPITGNWDGGRRSLPAIIRDTEWHLRRQQSGGSADWRFVYGRLTRGDLPLVGDWNADGRETIGIVRGGEWHLRDALSGGSATRAYVYGRVRAGDTPVVGDWNGDGRATPGIVRGGEWHLKDTHGGGSADRVIVFPAP